MMTGFGVDAVNPYLAFAGIQRLVDDGQMTDVDYKTGVKKYVKAAGKGMLKVMAKMGVSTIQASMRCRPRSLFLSFLSAQASIVHCFVHCFARGRLKVGWWLAHVPGARRPRSEPVVNGFSQILTRSPSR